MPNPPTLQIDPLLPPPINLVLVFSQSDSGNYLRIIKELTHAPLTLEF